MLNLHDIHVFTAGDRISSTGSKTKFTNIDLDQMVKNYDPSVHEAPVQLGHGKPKDSDPAYGWVKGLKRDGNKLYASVKFTEAGEKAIKSEAYRKRSSSFYRPDSEINPKHGEYYFRHLAILGGEIPAVKGLEDFAFSEDYAGDEFMELEFQDMEESQTETDETAIEMDEKESDEAPTMIESKPPLEEMDEAIKTAEMEAEAAAEEASKAAEENGGEPPMEDVVDETVTESTSNEEPEVEEVMDEVVEDSTDEPTVEEVQDEVVEEVDVVDSEEPEVMPQPSPEVDAIKAELEALRASHEESTRAMEELKAEVEAQKSRAMEAEKSARMMELESDVDEIYSEARLTEDIISKEDLMDYVEGLEYDTLEFAEGETAGTKLLNLLGKLKPMVDFGEVAADAEDPAPTPDEVEEMMEPDHIKAKKMADETGMEYTECLKRVMYPDHYPA